MEYLHFCWHYFLEMRKYSKVFMVGNSDRLFEDRGFRVGWRSKNFRYRISSYNTKFWYEMLSNNGTIHFTVSFLFVVARRLSTNSSTNFLWIPITQASSTHHREKKILIDMNALRLRHLIVLELLKLLLLETVGIR